MEKEGVYRCRIDFAIDTDIEEKERVELSLCISISIPQHSGLKDMTRLI
jgi:hypothetical protein